MWFYLRLNTWKIPQTHSSDWHHSFPSDCGNVGFRLLLAGIHRLSPAPRSSLKFLAKWVSHPRKPPYGSYHLQNQQGRDILQNNVLHLMWYNNIKSRNHLHAVIFVVIYWLEAWFYTRIEGITQKSWGQVKSLPTIHGVARRFTVCCPLSLGISP